MFTANNADVTAQVMPPRPECQQPSAAAPQLQADEPQLQADGPQLQTLDPQSQSCGKNLETASPHAQSAALDAAESLAVSPEATSAAGVAEQTCKPLDVLAGQGEDTASECVATSGHLQILLQKITLPAASQDDR